MIPVPGTVAFLWVWAMFVSLAVANEWTSPDGVITVNAPDSSVFQTIDNPPEPFIVLWISNDERLRLGVMKSNVPPNIKLIRASVEEGLTEQINGTVIASSITKQGDREIWFMTGKGQIGEAPVVITQALVHGENAYYKVMAVVRGQESNNSAAESFMGSIRIGRPTTALPLENSANEKYLSNGNWDSHDISKKIGGISALLLIAILSYLYFRRGKQRVVKI